MKIELTGLDIEDIWGIKNQCVIEFGSFGCYYITSLMPLKYFLEI